MAGRKVVSEQEARRCLAAARGAVGGLAAWARARGIDGRSLNAWRVNFDRRGQRRGKGASGLVELVPRGAPPSPPRYRLRVQGVELELGDDFNEGTIRRLVGLLKAC